MESLHAIIPSGYILNVTDNGFTITTPVMDIPKMSFDAIKDQKSSISVAFPSEEYEKMMAEGIIKDQKPSISLAFPSEKYEKMMAEGIINTAKYVISFGEKKCHTCGISCKNKKVIQVLNYFLFCDLECFKNLKKS